MEFSHFVAIYMKIAGKFGALKLGKSQRFICYRNEKPKVAVQICYTKRTQYGAADSL